MHVKYSIAVITMCDMLNLVDQKETRVSNLVAGQFSVVDDYVFIYKDIFIKIFIIMMSLLMKMSLVVTI